MQMRLLNVYTLEFRQFSSNPPNYAIASHRWKAGTEAFIKDIAKKLNVNKDGYQKVEGFAKYVREEVRHVEWLWIDTCCVNQDSSQEVTEAVNSMFRWYKNAEVCLAWLTDVENAGEEFEFRRSVWFRRGWTLQELLASHTIIFLSHAWELIGYKGGVAWAKSGFRLSHRLELENTIAEITGIPEEVLHDFGRSKSCTIQERLMWINGRETAREEDMSYSLLGIFDIAMPVIYGEGAGKARKRLLEEIQRTTKSEFGCSGMQTVSASTCRPCTAWIECQRLTPTKTSLPCPVPCAILPFRRDSDYVARDDILGQTYRRISSSEARVALVGLGGVGKSLLAIELAHQLREKEPKTWVFWVHASNAARFQQSVRTIAGQLKIATRDDPKANLLKLLEAWLREQGNGKWLLILDNADNPGFLRESPPTTNEATRVHSKAYLDYLPVCDRGSVLFTTRSRHAAMQLVDDKDVVVVPPMNENLAKSLLWKKLGPRYDMQDMADLVRELEFMPLAITQAAMYIQQRRPLCSVRQYLERLRKSDGSKMSLLDRDGGNLRRDIEASNSILLTWEISFEHIRKVRPSAADLLSLMSFFDRQAISESLLKERSKSTARVEDLTGKGEEGGVRDDRGVANEFLRDDEHEPPKASYDNDFEDDIAMLLSYSFIAATSNITEFRMHRLVQLSTQRWLKNRGQLSPWQERFVVNLDKAFPNGEYENWMTCRSLLPHVKSALNLRFPDQAVLLCWATVLYKAAFYLQSKGDAHDAEAIALCSAKARQRVLGLVHQDTLSSMEMVALSQKDQGRWDKAEELEIFVMESRMTVLGKVHRETLTSVSNLALLYWHQGRGAEARKLELQVLDTRMKVLGEEHPDTLTSMGNLALMYRHQGLWGEAEKLEVRVMKTRRWLLGLEHPDTLRSMGNLAATYRHQGRWDEAEKLELQVMRMRKSGLAEEHPDTLMSMGNLASTYRHQGRLTEAEELCMQVVTTSNKVLGSQHPSTLMSISNLASTYRYQRRWMDAEELDVQVMRKRQRTLGEEHPSTLGSMSNLAATYRNRGLWNKAEELCLQVIATRKRLLGEEHPVTLTCMDNLASTYRHQGRQSISQELGEHVMRTRQRVLGKEHPSTLMSMENLAHTLKETGADDAAHGLMRTCAKLSTKVLGDAHPYTTARDRLRDKWTEFITPPCSEAEKHECVFEHRAN